jgi:hypothetical protein
MENVMTCSYKSYSNYWSCTINIANTTRCIDKLYRDALDKDWYYSNRRLNTNKKDRICLYYICKTASLN